MLTAEKQRKKAKARLAGWDIFLLKVKGERDSNVRSAHREAPQPDDQGCARCATWLAQAATPSFHSRATGRPSRTSSSLNKASASARAAAMPMRVRTIVHRNDSRSVGRGGAVGKVHDLYAAISDLSFRTRIGRARPALAA